MNKYIVTFLIVLTSLLTACGYRDYRYRNFSGISGQAVSGGGTKMTRPSASPSSDNGAAVVSGNGIHTASHVTAQMQTAEFWIGKTVSPDRVLMSQKDIRKLNNKMNETLPGNPEAVYHDLSKYGEYIDGTALYDQISRQGKFEGSYYLGESEVTGAQWDSYRALCNLDAIVDSNKIRYGIVCSRADVRSLPVMDNITDTKGDTGHDILQNTALAVNEPVLILHASSDGKWFYVVANEYAGWTLQDCVGLCQNREMWTAAQKMEDFIVVTGDEISLSVSSADHGIRSSVYTMGTKLAIARESEYDAAMKQKNIFDNYVVRIPVRDEEGSLAYQTALIPLGRDVSHGYLDYTRGNVIRQAFKLLGNPYGWGGMAGGRDCSSMTRDIYLCFGFRLPRDASSQALIPAKGCVKLDGLAEKEKKNKLNSIQPGTILQMPEHVMIYLGCQDQRYYVISANGTFIPAGEEKQANTNYQTRLVTVNDLQVKSPSNSKTWREQIRTIVGIP